MTAMPATPAARNKQVLGWSLATVGLMLGLSFASVPLYDLFCRLTGFGGATVQAAAAPGVVLARQVKVGFVTSVSADLPWTFTPLERELTVKVGEPRETTYRVTNTSNKTLVGVATYNVLPAKIGGYFNKILCFCFSEQVLQPGETKDYKVIFFLDPDMAKDSNLEDVKDITLSYTFFLAKDQSKAKSVP